MRGEVVNFRLPGARHPIRVLVVACLSDIDKALASRIAERLRSENVPLAILFHRGRLEDEARRLFKSRGYLMTEMMDRIVSFPLSHRDTRVLMGASLAEERHVDIDKSAMENELENVLMAGRLRERLESWLKDMEERGLVTCELDKPAGTDERELIDALLFYVNFYHELPLSPSEVFDRHKQLFAKKVVAVSRQQPGVPDNHKLKVIGFMPHDWETATKLRGLTPYLVKNGFLNEEGDRYQIVTTRQEEVIISFLNRKGGSASVDSIKALFVNTSAFEEPPIDRYLRILSKKGLIRWEGNRVSLVSLSELYDRVIEYERDAERLYKELKQIEDDYGSSALDYAYAFQVKRRDQWSVNMEKCLEAFHEVVEAVKKNAHLRELTADDGEAFLIKGPKLAVPARLAIEIYEERIEALKEIWREPRREALAKLNDMRSKLDEIQSLLESLFEELRLDVKPRVEDVGEYRQLKEWYDKAVEIHKMPPDDELINRVSRLLDVERDDWRYTVDKRNAIAYCHEKFNEIYESAKKHIDKIREALREYGMDMDTLRAKLKELSDEYCEKELALSQALCKVLEDLFGEKGG